MADSASKIPTRNDTNLERSSRETIESCNKSYRELVVALMYVACCIIPVIMFAAAYLARCLPCYGDEHWNKARRVQKYLVSSMDVRVCYGLRNELVVGHTDADWAGDKITRKSRGGFVFMLAGACISWSSKRQSTNKG